MTAGTPLDETVRGLLHRALQLYRQLPWMSDRLQEELARLEQPLRVAIAGPWRSGRSTLLNAIMGEEVAPVDGAAGDTFFTWYQDGARPQATAYSANYPPQELGVVKSATGMRVDLAGWRAGELRDVVVRWPTRALRQLTLIDTPPVTAPREHGRAAVLDRVLREADAVLYLSRDGRSSDLRALRAARDSACGQAAPVNTMLVLSRADEMGGGRIDALLTARQVARRLHRDTGIAALCLTVLPCSGVVGLAGRSLTEAEFAALAELARVPRPELEWHLLSADRFLRVDPPARVDAAQRAALLDRLRLFGVRLATTLVRTGCDSRAKLSAELIRRSGLAELREAISRFFIDQRETLKARSVLVALEELVRAEPGPGTGELLGSIERILAGAHEFQELRLLAALPGPGLGFDADLVTEARRLVGGDGAGLAARLGFEHNAPMHQLWQAAAEAHWRWRDRAEDPLLSLVQRRGAQVVVRSCEGMLATLAATGR